MPDGKKPSLTENEIRDLATACRHPDGVFRINSPRGLRYASKERSARKMVAAGLIEPNAHGDWYVTQAGRDLVAANAAGVED